ncbi:Zn(2)-C6 fungal-type domain-containing protein [Pleurotus pulmonarius]
MSSPENQQESAFPALPRGSACRNCRRRKVKCDGVKPICGACSRSLGSFSDCEYVESGRSQTQIMEESIALIESRIRELESPDSSNHSVTLQNPYPFSGPSTSVQSSSMTINMDMFLGGVAWTRPTAYNALSGVALPSPIPASMAGPNEPRGVINIGLRQEEPPAAIMQALVHTFIHHSAEIGCFLNIPRLLEVTDHPDANVRPLPALMVAIYLWGIRLCNSAEFNDYEELYLSRAVDQAAQSLPLDRPRKVLQKIQAEILLAYFFFSKGRNVEGRYHTSIVIGAILGSQLHKYGGLEQGEGICATFWSPTTDLIDHGERIDAVWAAVVLTNTWSAVLSAPSDIPFNSPGFTIDAPWPLDTYGDMALQSLPVSKGTIQKFLREPTVAEGRSIKAFLAKAAVLLERASYLHSQYRPDAPENETAGLKNSIPILDNVIEAYLASGLPRLDQASNPSDRMNITLAHTIVHAARIKLQSTRVLGYDVAPRKKVLQAAEGVLEIAHQNLLQEPEFVNPIFGHLWTICALAYISEIERMRTGDSVTDVTEIHLLQKVDKLVELMAKFADRFCWRGSMETIEVARTKSSR